MEKNKSLKKDLESVIRKSQGDIDADVKVSVYDINTGINASVKGNKKGWAASIIKLPIMISTLNEIEKGNLSLKTKLPVRHEFMLEPTDYVSTLPDNAELDVRDLLDYMIAESDNEATNILVDYRGGPEKINKDLKNLSIRRTRLGHLLCPNVKKYKNFFLNPDGSNITTPNDMTKVMRYIYDPSSNKLSKNTKSLADSFMNNTRASFITHKKFKDKNIKAKIGIISDDQAGDDIHEVGIIDNSLIVSLMANKIGQINIKNENFYSTLEHFGLYNGLVNNSREFYKKARTYKEAGKVKNTYKEIMNVLNDYF